MCYTNTHITQTFWSWTCYSWSWSFNY